MQRIARTQRNIRHTTSRYPEELTAQFNVDTICHIGCTQQLGKGGRYLAKGLSQRYEMKLCASSAQLKLHLCPSKRLRQISQTQSVLSPANESHKCRCAF